MNDLLLVLLGTLLGFVTCFKLHAKLSRWWRG